MAYLRCPDCRLTASAAAYFVHGDRCPRCLTTMEPAERFRDAAPKAQAGALLAVRDDAAGLAARPPAR